MANDTPTGNRFKVLAPPNKLEPYHESDATFRRSFGVQHSGDVLLHPSQSDYLVLSGPKDLGATKNQIESYIRDARTSGSKDPFLLFHAPSHSADAMSSYANTDKDVGELLSVLGQKRLYDVNGAPDAVGFASNQQPSSLSDKLKKGFKETDEALGKDVEQIGHEIKKVGKHIEEGAKNFFNSLGIKR